MAALLLPLVDLVLGVMLLATIGFAATGAFLQTRDASWRRPVGWLLVAVPLPAVVVSRLVLPSTAFGGQVAFVLGLVAFGLGTVLILSTPDDMEDGGGTSDLDPTPWWPEFERAFYAYQRRDSKRRVRV